MPNDNTADDVKDQDPNEEGESGDENTENDSNAEEGADNPSDDEGEDGDDSDDDDEDKNDDTDSDEDDDDDEPKTRRQSKEDNKFFARRRVAGKRANKGKSDKDDKPDDEDDADDGGDDSNDIDQRIQKHLEPITKRIEQEEDDRDISDFLKENPEFKSYEKKVRKYASHPSRKDIPIDELFYSVAGKDILKLGAKRARKSDAEAGQNKSGGGSSTRTAPSGKSVKDMDSKEFEEYQNSIRMKR